MQYGLCVFVIMCSVFPPDGLTGAKKKKKKTLIFNAKMPIYSSVQQFTLQSSLCSLYQ